jgi:hypothetical protein
MRIIRRDHPDLVPLYTRLYPEGSYAQAQPWRQVGLQIKEYCARAGISDRIPRPIIPGEKRELNKRIVEVLVYKLHLLELENAATSQIWAYRKAAWAVEDVVQDVGLVYRSLGRKGLESIPGISPSLGGEIEALIDVK